MSSYGYLPASYFSPGATNAFDEHCSRLEGVSMELRDRLTDSEEKALDLEDKLHREQERHAAFEVEAENL
ncbi:hypothetical protein GUJ93_ZPchr0007g3709 [Zizania palustris]|uniref:Uncharacterized protein n=1 Tax=Zizania palustris TaxID=103762 RepID=A0A8J5W5H0_ZIZPA|nr:hypothetical protein GUJ93_ZPchr0007g3709 [Zizania palustris]